MIKVIAGFKKVGLEVSEDWLKIEKGNRPTYQGNVIQLDAPEISAPFAIDLPLCDASTQLARIFAEETKLFTSLEYAVIAKVDHSKLAPLLEQGDHAGGFWQAAETLGAQPTLCIFQLQNNLHVACVKRNTHDGMFTFSYSTKEVKAAKKISLERLAPIVRVWR